MIINVKIIDMLWEFFLLCISNDYSDTSVISSKVVGYMSHHGCEVCESGVCVCVPVGGWHKKRILSHRSGWCAGWKVSFNTSLRTTTSLLSGCKASNARLKMYLLSLTKRTNRAKQSKPLHIYYFSTKQVTMWQCTFSDSE